ncbi:C40 family peptidase [Actinotignum urinale]|uniref:NlpC/P60 family protein n=2 Tax=Actinotignum urinale TaxID=190146 RepID=A0ABU5G7R3_9ACTO|nr:C40 family peptidase [Actinotignum urinale]MDY5129379.1 NlpC/P60 family protein [Actinotignum urinale]MDY5132959.1 NlpC/P60 family protein [Actinotignum urinale]MDY5161099.1 NlpC/P60 family protein [Actinotignum urinale]
MNISKGKIVKVSPRKAVALLAATSLGFSVIPSTFADDVSDEEIRVAKNAENATAQSIAGLEAQLAGLSAQAEMARTNVVQKEAAALATQEKLEEAIGLAEDAQIAANNARGNAQATQKELGRISSAMYRDSSTRFSTASAFFGATSLRDAQDRHRAFRTAGQVTDQKLQKYEATRDIANNLQKEADKKAEEQGKVAARAERLAVSAQKAAEGLNAKLAEISTQREALFVQLAAQKGTTAELERMQQEQKEAVARAAAEAERKRIEEEAAANATATAERERQENEENAKAEKRRAAIEAQRQVAAQRERERAQQQEQQRRQEQSRPARPARGWEPDDASSSNSNASVIPAPSGIGGDIVRYARQFAGTPYVWGGTTPRGWDCSGFTSYIYRKFGVNLPRTSGAQRGAGREIPASQARPGDLLWWPGHVGIYTGNGMHIAARNPAKGTGEAPIWGNPRYIRVIG